MDAVFRALADPNRRRLLDRLNARNGQTLSELCVDLGMARQSVSKHLHVLEAAHLVTTRRRGREKLHYLNAAPINEISDRWISPYARERAQALADLKRALEDRHVEHADFVYTTYIRSTPEQVWKALTSPIFTQRYWGVSFETDWKAGSTMAWIDQGVRIADPAQVVLEADPHRSLSYTWHTPTPEWADAHRIDTTLQQGLAAEQRTRVAFDIEPTDGLVKLTVTHADFEQDSTLRSMCSQGWPRLIAGLKTLLETGGELEVRSLAPKPEPAT